MKKLLIALIGLGCLLYSCNKETVSTDKPLALKSIENSAVVNSKEDLLVASFEDYMKNIDGTVVKIESANQRMVNDGCIGEVVSDDIPCEEYQITETIAVPPYCESVEVSYTLVFCPDLYYNQIRSLFMVSNFTATPSGIDLSLIHI